MSKFNLGLGLKLNSGELNKIKKQLESGLKVKLTLDASSIKEQVKRNVEKSAKEVEKIINSSSIEMQPKAKANYFNKISNQYATEKISKDIQGLRNNLDKLGSSASDLENNYKKVTASYSGFTNALKSKDIDGAISKYKELYSEIDKMKNLTRIKANEKTINALKENKANLVKEIQDVMSGLENGSEHKIKLGSLLGNVNKDGLTNLKKYKGELKSILKEIDSVTNGNKAQTKQSGLFGGFSDISKHALALASAYVSIQLVTRGLKEMYNNVLAVDTAMVELKKVTNESGTVYSKFLNTSIKDSKSIGTSVSNFIQSTADFARLGYSLKESRDLSKTANIYNVVGDKVGGIENATNSIISTMKAFDIQADKSITVVDKFNNIGNKFAISSGGIGEAFKRSASSLRSANNDIDESIALITGGNTVVQDPVSVGQAFKTLTMRIRSAKTELEDAGLDTEGMALSSAKLREELMAIAKVDIMKDNNTFKSTYDILDELAYKWKDLSDIQQATITELIAGKRQGNIVSSLLNNFDVARNVLEESRNSDGSAMKEHEKYMDSVQAKQDQLKASMEELSISFLESGFLKGGIDGLRGLVEGFTALNKAITPFGTLTIAVGLFKLIAGLKELKKTDQYKDVGIFKILKDELPKSFKSLTNSVNGFFNGLVGSEMFTGSALTLGLTAGITAIGLIIAKVVNDIEEQKKRIAQAGAEAKELNKQISDRNKTQSEYKELKKELDSVTVSESRSAEIKSKILGIQNNLIETYGTQLGAIDLVNGSLEQQLAIMEKISRQDATEWLNQNRDNIEKSKTELAKKKSNTISLKQDSFDALENNKINGALKEIAKRNNVTASPFLSEDRGASLFLDGTLENSKNFIDDFMEYLDKNLGSFDAKTQKQINSLRASLSKSIDGKGGLLDLDYTKELDTYKEIYEQAQKLELISDSDEEGGKTAIKRMAELEDAQQNLNRAIKSGDANQIESAKRRYSIVKEEIKSTNAYIKHKEEFDKKISSGELPFAQYNLENEVKKSDKFKKSVETLQKLSNVELSNLKIGGTDSASKSLTDILAKVKELNPSLEALSEQEQIDFVLDFVVNNRNALDDTIATVQTFEERLDSLKQRMNDFKEFYSQLTSSVSASNSGTGISRGELDAIHNMYKGIEGYSQSNLFERTANGISLNTKALELLQKQTEQTFKADFDKEINTLVKELNAKQDLLRSGSLTQQDRSALNGEIESLRENIESVQLLKSEYEGLTSSYNKWINAKNTSNNGDMYDNIFKGIEENENALKDGLIGTDDFKSFAQLISYQDLTGKSAIEIQSIYSGLLPTIKGFFQEGKDGCINFLNAVNNLNSAWAYQKDNGDWQIDFVGKDDEVAEKLGISVEAVQSIMRKLSDYGFDIDLDSPIQSFEELQSSIAKTEEELKSLGVTSIEIPTEISTENADITIQSLKDKIAELESKEVTLRTDEENRSLEILKNDLYYVALEKEKLSTPTYLNIETGDIDVSLSNSYQLVSDLVTQIQVLNAMQVSGLDTTEQQKNVEELASKIASLDKDVKLKVGLVGDNGEVLSSANGILDKISNSNTVLNFKAGIDKSQIEQDLNIEKKLNLDVNVDSEKLNALEERINSLNGKTITINANLPDVQKINALTSATGKVKGKNVSVSANVYGKGLTQGLYEAIDKVKGKNVSVVASVYGRYLVDALATAISNLRSKTVYVNTIRTSSGSMQPMVNGTAFAKGSWGTKDSGTALVGELGEELLVRNGNFMTIGSNSAELIKYQKGDIIFNAQQTKDILKNGKITRGKKRGRAFSSGVGRFLDWNKEIVNNVNTRNSVGSNSGGVSAPKSDGGKDFKETLDWIEVALKRIEKVANRLSKKAKDSYSVFDKRNVALKQQINTVTQEIDLQRKAWTRYIQQANSVPLSNHWKALVENGQVKIEEITDKGLAENIKRYKEWYEKALACEDAVQDLAGSVKSLYEDSFNGISNEFDNILSSITHKSNILELSIKQTKESGLLLSDSFYKDLKSIELDKMNNLLLKEEELNNSLSNAISNGGIEEGSESWYKMKKEIYDVAEAIESSKLKLIEFDNQIRSVNWEIFDTLQEQISNVSSEAKFFIDLMKNKKLFTDVGEITEQGNLTLGMYGLEYNTYMEQALSYARELEKIDKVIQSNPKDLNLMKRRKELMKSHQDMILMAESSKNSIVDLMKDSIQSQLKSVDKLIKKYNEMNGSQKSLYDYENKIKDKVEEISEIKKQLSAYNGDDSEETRTRVQELNISLQKAEDNLQEAQMDRMISEQKQLLDSLYDEYELLLNQRLDNVDALINDVILNINGSSSSIAETITKESSNVGYLVTQTMKDIWNIESAGDKSLKDVLRVYNGDFNSFSGNFSSYKKELGSSMTTVQNILSQINIGIGELVKKSTGKSHIKSETPKAKPKSKPQPPKSTPSKVSKPQQNNRFGSGKVGIGSRVKFDNGIYFENSYGQGLSGYMYRGGYVYITNVNPNSPFPYHISTGNRLGIGDLGWLKLSQLSGYASGKYNVDKDKLAWTQENGSEFIIRKSDGAILTPLHSGDSVLNAMATRNLWEVANNPQDFIGQHLGFTTGSSLSKSTNSTVQNFDNINFVLPNVRNYSELLNEMKSDKKFEKLIQSMTIGKLNGSSDVRNIRF